MSKSPKFDAKLFRELVPDTLFPQILRNYIDMNHEESLKRSDADGIKAVDDIIRRSSVRGYPFITQQGRVTYIKAHDVTTFYQSYTYQLLQPISELAASTMHGQQIDWPAYILEDRIRLRRNYGKMLIKRLQRERMQHRVLYKCICATTNKLTSIHNALLVYRDVLDALYETDKKAVSWNTPKPVNDLVTPIVKKRKRPRTHQLTVPREIFRIEDHVRRHADMLSWMNDPNPRQNAEAFFDADVRETAII